MYGNITRENQSCILSFKVVFCIHDGASLPEGKFVETSVEFAHTERHYTERFMWTCSDQCWCGITTFCRALVLSILSSPPLMGL